jgi:ubiquinone/menaquinone biosynthesis C-methylase UbiE
MTSLNDIPIGSIRESYDRLAEEYANHLFNELQNKPFDRNLLERFAAGVSGQVCDMGCGPGHMARHLRDAGVTVSGLDLSTQMLGQARQRNPDIRFREGNMLALDLEENTLAGITAFYATVNLPPESWPLVFREMERVLQPNGLLLLAFHIRGSGFSNPRERIILPFLGFSPGENAPSCPIYPYIFRELDHSRTSRASPIRSHGSASGRCSCG